MIAKVAAIFALVCYNISSHITARKEQISRAGASMAATSKQTILHRAGMALSGLCLVHCLALPLVLAAVPLSLVASVPAQWAETEWFHAGLIAPVVLISGTALLRAGRVSLAVLAASLGALVAALFVANEALETALTTAGAGALLAAHWFGLRQPGTDGQKACDNIT